MKWPRWVALLAALLAFVAACTASVPPPSTPTPTVAASAPTDANTQPRDRISDGGTVRMPLRHLPTAWNPWHRDGRTPEAERVRTPMSAGAFTFDAAGHPSPHPAYLTKAQATHDTHTTVTLSLNTQAVWSDGAAITANDWIATWKALNGHDPAFELAGDTGWRGVTDVRAGADAYTVVIDFAGLEPDWSRPLAAGPARAESVRDPATFNSGWPEYQAGWFTGPFVLSHVDRAQGVITLERNPLWWGDPPKLNHVVFRTIQPEAVAAAFHHNEFDWLPVDSVERLEQVRVAPDAIVRAAPGTTGRLLRLNTAGVLADPKLRLALLRALDREALGRADIAGIVDERLVRIWGNQLLLPTQPGYVDQARATGQGHDRAAASELFTQAGWVLVDGYRMRDGQRLTLSMALDPSDRRTRAEHAALAATLSDLGVTLTTATEGADLTAVSQKIDRYPLTAVAGITDPAVADLVMKVRTEVDPVRRADKAAQLSRALWGNSDVITLYQRPEAFAVRNGLANLGATGFASVRWEDVGWAR